MTVLNDIRYGFRMLVKRPGLSAIAIIALALGIGLTTTMFGIIYGAVIKGLPFDESENLTALFRNRPAQDLQRIHRGALIVQDRDSRITRLKINHA